MSPSGFLVYSILGWVVESIYMSICNRRLTNRGFVRGPFCPIYGVGALSVFFLLRPFCHNLLLLYVLGCVFPTLLEYLTARLMLSMFGEVWWDYSEKPFNYKGILCLESTIAWGFYTLACFCSCMKVGGTFCGQLSVFRWIPGRVPDSVLVHSRFFTYFIRKEKDSLPSSSRGGGGEIRSRSTADFLKEGRLRASLYFAEHTPNQPAW